MGMDLLDRLATLAGIEEGWVDFFGRYRPVSAETKRTFLSAMGFPVGTDDELSFSYWRLETQPWRRMLPAVAVSIDTDGPPATTVTLPMSEAGSSFAWTVEEEGGALHTGSVVPDALALLASREIDGVAHGRFCFKLPGTPWPGVHRLRLDAPDGRSASMPLIVSPTKAFRPTGLTEGRGFWGYTTQLYALKRKNNWGIGDFSDLARLAHLAGGQGAQAIGINPLHALFSAQPERCSPYSPSSRQFLNVIAIDVEAVADVMESQDARRLLDDGAVKSEIKRLGRLSLIDYGAVGRMKRRILDLGWQSFRQRHLDDPLSPRGLAFGAFCRLGGTALQRFALFEAIQEHLLAANPDLGYWRVWPAEFRDPDGPSVAAFARSHGERVSFHCYLQWLADDQLAGAQASCRASGMALGVYRDLGVGIAGDGAEAWANQKLLSLGVSVGAPPDPLNLAGQDWGLVPFNPLALEEAAYLPFLDVLEANMRHAGAMRLDHAMSLARLYWVPNGAKADQGAYVRYPADDLFAIAALASARQQCLLIGEDLGTVPDGFRGRMSDRGILGYRLLVFEHQSDGFTSPEALPRQALVGFGTHDLPSLAGWWRGIDLEARLRHNLYPDPAMAEHEALQRAADRQAMVTALAGQGLLAADFPCEADIGEDLLSQVASAVYHYLGASPAELLMVQFEDVLGLVLQMNLPGTTDQHPNWRARYPQEIGPMMADQRVSTLAAWLSARGGADLPGEDDDPVLALGAV